MYGKSLLTVLILVAGCCGNNAREDPTSLADAADFSPELAPGPPNGSDYFHCFTAGTCPPPALSNSTACQRDRDYTITVNVTSGPVAILSIHGGQIEPNTTEVSDEAARRFGWSRYDFSGHGTPPCLGSWTNRDRLHITAANFAEPEAVNLVTQHTKVVSIHGDRNIIQTGSMCIGGGNQEQIAAFISEINENKTSFNQFALRPISAPKIRVFPCSAVAGIEQLNIVNRAAGGKGGLQLELSLPLLANLASSDAQYQALRNIFYDALRSAMKH